MLKTDILIIGSGISGLFFAMKTAKKRPDLSIVIMTKETAKNTNTQLAQGGIAVVTDHLKDSFNKHIHDTLRSGGGLCDKEIVNMVIKQAPERIQELIEIGTSFDKNEKGQWDLGLEGGHSQNRILHHKDSSGLEIEQKLLKIIKKMPNIELLENHLVIDLNTEVKRNRTICTGAFFYEKKYNRIKYIRTRTVVLSTGGCGQLFENTTNPKIATGDGIAMAARAGAEIVDMQYMQFHPTALFTGKENPLFLISEAVRGFGAHIVNDDGKRFLFKYDIRGELATRDMVSDAITKQLRLSGKNHVYLDCRHLNKAEFYAHFPVIAAHCNELGIKPEKDLIPVVPAAHYQCGGIKVDQNGATAIKNLYAVGECARTGLHGKNRLASNSLLEALVFAHQASENVDKTIAEFIFSSKILIPKFPKAHRVDDYMAFEILKKELQKLVTSFYTSEERDAEQVFIKIKELHNYAVSLTESHEITIPFIEFSNMIATALLIIKQCKEAPNKQMC
ncbi:L-aspartate oxidase [Flavobacterium nitrogenifigens]|uniref:L-aspartate oxidase n=2 Tax=Flavobacterium TaxID=237 RepID=A0A7W7J2D3_9FLAO|nr:MULTISPECIES: L-aspartate oxidase [Flavobacterium]MBB4804628.1 L-aspartate oxidase [Flavobacterium nitrogenifigens]MBB6389587.1 L-aspartate oxidase [Flavobacterium notoginsengisoli]